MSLIKNFVLAAAIATVPVALTVSPAVAEAGVATAGELKATRELANARAQLALINNNYLAARATYLERQRATDEALRVLNLANQNLANAEASQRQAALILSQHKKDSETDKAQALVDQATADLLKAQEQRRNLTAAYNDSQGQLNTAQNTLSNLGTQLNLATTQVSNLTALAASVAAQAHPSPQPATGSVADKIANGHFDAVLLAVPNNSSNGDTDIKYLDLHARAMSVSRNLPTNTDNPVREAVAAYLISVYIGNTQIPSIIALQAQVNHFNQDQLKIIVKWYLHHNQPVQPVVIVPTTPPAVTTNPAQPPPVILRKFRPPGYGEYLGKELSIYGVGQVLEYIFQQNMGYKDPSVDDRLPCVDNETTYNILYATYHLLKGAAALGEAQGNTQFDFNGHASLATIHGVASYLNRDGHLNEMSMPTRCSGVFKINIDSYLEPLNLLGAKEDNFGNRADTSRLKPATDLTLPPNNPYGINNTWTTQIRNQDIGQWPTELFLQEHKIKDKAPRRGTNATRSPRHTPEK